MAFHHEFQILQDTARLCAFRDALALAVPDCGRVLHLGGGTGALSYFAAQRACRVWCVERHPGMAERAREILALNAPRGWVEVVCGDAMDYLPPDPVDVVVCEMLHTGLLCRKQVAVIDVFKKRYTQRFGENLPLFLPEAAVLGVEPVYQNFDLCGYYAPVPLFENSFAPVQRPVALSAPQVYQIVQYIQPLAPRYLFEGMFEIQLSGRLNALRFITTHALLILPQENRSVNWASQNLVLPLGEELQVEAGGRVRVSFAYSPGDEVETLMESLYVEPVR